MIEALKMLIQGDEEKLKISTDLFKYAMMNNGEKMLDHQIEEILTDSDLVFDDQLVIEEFAKYLMSK